MTKKARGEEVFRNSLLDRGDLEDWRGGGPGGGGGVNAAEGTAPAQGEEEAETDGEAGVL